MFILSFLLKLFSISHVQKRNNKYYLSLKFIIFIYLKNKKKYFLNYNRYKLLTFTQKNKRASKHT